MSIFKAMSLNVDRSPWPLFVRKRMLALRQTENRSIKDIVGFVKTIGCKDATFNAVAKVLRRYAQYGNCSDKPKTGVVKLTGLTDSEVHLQIRSTSVHCYSCSVLQLSAV